MSADRAHALLREVFGFADYRPVQADVVAQLIAGGDAFLLMPTGGGKSLCYQLPALVRPGTGIVVSPLIALMKDQVDALRACGVRAAAFNSSLEHEEARQVLARLHGNGLDLLYVAPETLMSGSFLSRLAEIAAGEPGVALFAIDEAHCVSQWGHDFRPDYVRLGELRERFPRVPIVACTATADPQTRDDVRARLGLSAAPCFATGFDRPNIRYTVAEKREPLQQLKRFLNDHPDEAGIVYCLSRKRTEEIAAKLVATGIPAAAYHAGLSPDERRRVQDAFARDEVPIVVATVAFGMGIDKSNVRFVVHFDLPKSIESYYQETGRAGRDGLPAEALLLFGLGDAPVVRALIERGGADADAAPRHPAQVRLELRKLESMVAYADGLTCRRKALLGYFGETVERDCGNCDICLAPPVTFDATVHAQMVLSCVHRVGQSFGAGHIVDCLMGTDTERIKARGHDRLSTYGIGAEESRDYWRSIIRQLIHRGYLKQDVARYSVLLLTEKARPLLRGDETLVLARPRLRSLGVRSSSAKLGGAKLGGTLAHRDERLFSSLKALRRQLAEQQSVPAYVVFSDATLAAMATQRPRTSEEMLAITGVGQTKLHRYGAEFLATIVAETRPAAHDDQR